MENYKQKYEAALEQAKQELKACGSQDCDAARQIFRLFPELKKSEDVKIMKNKLMERPSDESVRNVYSGLSRLDDALQHTFYGSEMHNHKFHGGEDTWSFPDGVREKLKDDKRYRVWYKRYDAADPYDTSCDYHVYYIKEI